MMTNWRRMQLMGVPVNRFRVAKSFGASPISAMPTSWNESSSSSEAKSPHVDRAEVATTQTPSQLPPTRSATEVSEPSVQHRQPGSAPAPAKSGRMYIVTMKATERKSARGKVLCGSSTSPANVDAESNPDRFQ